MYWKDRQQKYRKHRKDMLEKYMRNFENDTKDFEMSEPNKEEHIHQQEPQELKKEKPQQEKPQQEKPQQEKPAEADLAAGGGAKTTLLTKAWLPAEPNKAGFAGQGRSAQ